MKTMGYTQSKGDYTFFIKHSREGKVTALLVYVNDIIVTSDDEEELKVLKGNLAQEFEIKNLGVLKYFLEIEVAYFRDCIFLSQRKYILDLLAEIGLTRGKMSSIPIEPNCKLWQNPVSQPIDKGRY